MTKHVTRLLNQFAPKSYNLTIQTDAPKAKFAGKIIIEGKKVGRPAKRITLHQKDLRIKKVLLYKHIKKSSSKEEIRINRIYCHKKYDELRIHSEEILYPGEYMIHIEYSGDITKPMEGVYPCFFEYEEQKKQLLATQFESHHARAVFPCIDEPAAKATFDFSLLHDIHDVALSNTPIQNSVTLTSKDKTLLANTSYSKVQKATFQTTPIMSTYLLAFIQGDLRYKESKTKDGTLVRAYATPDNVQFTDFALDVAVKCLEFYNEYFGIPYPLEKCDLIALPDFASGAMENWGCITFREQCMLVDPKNTSLPNKQYVAMVVAHELAHQWFGNLVTMRWWTDLWLNEGFASWIEYMAVDYIFPEWQMWTQFTIDEQHRALRLDSLEHTHPIEVPIKNPDEIRSIFDTISYSKGASVIHMLHQYLGKDHFKDGLRYYLKKHAYANTDTVDLWRALEKISKKPVQSYMHSWTTQEGFPVVRVSKDDRAEDTHTISQQRFLINQTVPDAKKLHSSCWPIALQANQPIKPELFDSPTAVLHFKASSPLPLKLNSGQSGFFRVAYSEEQLEQLIPLIANKRLDCLDRLGILSDTIETIKAGFMPTRSFFQIVSALKEEDDYVVWDVIASGLGAIRSVMDNEEIRELMKPLSRQLAQKQYTRLGWEPRSDDVYFDQLLRPLIFGIMTTAEDSSAEKKALSLFDSTDTIDNIPPDIRSTVLSTTVRIRNDGKTFAKIVHMYHNAKLSEEKTTIAAALCSFKDQEIFDKSLSFIQDSDFVRPQDIAYWVVYCFSNRFGKQKAWIWLQDNWQWLLDTVGSDLSFYRFPIYVANSFSDEHMLQEFKKFFEPRSNPAIKRSINQGIEILQWQAAWKKRDQQDTINFLRSL
jgi:aminopeptidase N